MKSANGTQSNGATARKIERDEEFVLGWSSDGRDITLTVRVKGWEKVWDEFQRASDHRLDLTRVR